MGQFYKTSYFKMQLKKIAEMPNDHETESEEDISHSKSISVSAVNVEPTDNAEYPDLSKSKSASLSKSKSASLSKSKSNASASKSSAGSSSVPSSVSSRCSSIATMMKPFVAQENLKRVSVISVESLEHYNKRQSESKQINMS
jgi:hypothetical protein